MALRALLDEPAPPAANPLEQVLRRGRRRVRGQRLGVVVIVVAVVAAIGGGTLALWPPAADPQPSAADRLATGYQWPEELAGWEPVAAACPSSATVTARGSVALLPEATVEPAFVAGVAAVTGSPADVALSEWDVRGYVMVEVPVAGALGSVHLEATTAAAAPPSAAADADVGVYGQCTVPLRKTLGDGAVLQLYAPDLRSPTAPVQHLRTYLPSGRLYVVSSAGWSRSDVSTVDSLGGVVKTGRGRLPLDSQQLADVATRVAALE